jgi:hypothetical protein
MSSLCYSIFFFKVNLNMNTNVIVDFFKGESKHEY